MNDINATLKRTTWEKNLDKGSEVWYWDDSEGKAKRGEVDGPKNTGGTISVDGLPRPPGNLYASEEDVLASRR